MTRNFVPPRPPLRSQLRRILHSRAVILLLCALGLIMVAGDALGVW